MGNVKNQIVMKSKSRTRQRPKMYQRWKVKRVKWIYLDEIIETNELMFECFIKLPLHIVERIYCFLPNDPCIDNMYQIYLRSQHQIKIEQLDHVKHLGLALPASRLRKLYSLYAKQ